MARDWRPRVTVDVTPELYNKLQDVIPWGSRNAVLTEVLEQLLTAIEKGGGVVVYLVANKKLPMFGAISPEIERVLKNGSEGII